jgi:UPF0716 protein FxsA
MIWLFLLFVVAPVAELYVIVQVSGAIGFLETLVLLVVVAAVGAFLIKREGLRVWRRFNEQMAAGKVPEKELADGVLLLIAGALMLAPGFVSDIVALLLVLPPTRAVARALLLRRRGGPGRMTVVTATYGGPMDGTITAFGRVTDTTATDTTATDTTGTGTDTTATDTTGTDATGTDANRTETRGELDS